MKQIVRNYEILQDIPNTPFTPIGDSGAAKDLIFHIRSHDVPTQVLDIGFGKGKLGQLIKNTPSTAHWQIDGIDGYEHTCLNKALFDEKIYRNVWHGFAQDLSLDALRDYDVICLLDVIEHLDADTAKWLLRTLLMSLKDDAFLFISTPLWFYPQHEASTGDLEEHLIGIPASAIMPLQPIMYAISNEFVGNFVFTKKALISLSFSTPPTIKISLWKWGRK